MEQLNILALSGSLREASYNSAAIRALPELAPEHINLNVYKGLGDIPLFNPDREDEHIPASEKLRLALAQADGLIIASPEYAHGVSGVLKNALDWLVSGEEFIHMPVALINTSPRATHAQAMLREIIRTMSGCIVEEACISVPLLGSNLDTDGIVQHADIANILRASLAKFGDSLVKSRNR